MSTLVMGILNVTPDSFADGGRHFTFADAIGRAEVMIDEGVDIIDVGGESTRPGAVRVDEEEELKRVIPVIEEIAKLGATVSVDTMRSNVAKAAIKAGARYVNDVSGGLADPKMSSVIASNSQVQYIAMHWRGHSENMAELARYNDVVSDVRRELATRTEVLVTEGVDPDQIIIDPGLGFSKEPEHNWALLKGLDRIALLGFPLLIGASRKRFLGELLGGVATDEREFATIAVTAILAREGVWGVRTHSVKAHKDAIKVVERWNE
ncbi:MAG: dihydropteroate synthase [Candidatus Nanopelagicaceae bacterium]